MAKLWFRYGAMGASKTANALMVAYNYEEKDLKPLVLKPACENRDGEKVIKSRAFKDARPCEFVEDFIFGSDDMLEEEQQKQLEATFEKVSDYDAIIVDECQFMTPYQVKVLRKIVDELEIPVMCYGLLTDFKNDFFPGSEALMNLSDNREEIKTICWCGDGAKCNARLNEKGEVVRKGNQIELGGTETASELPKYTSLCRKHYEEGDIGPKMKARFRKYYEEKGQGNALLEENQEKKEVHSEKQPFYLSLYKKDANWNNHFQIVAFFHSISQIDEFCDTIGTRFVPVIEREKMKSDLRFKLRFGNEGSIVRVFPCDSNDLMYLPKKYDHTIVSKLGADKINLFKSDVTKNEIKEHFDNIVATMDRYDDYTIGPDTIIEAEGINCNLWVRLYNDRGNYYILYGYIGEDGYPDILNERGESVFDYQEEMCLSNEEVEEIKGVTTNDMERE